MPEQLVIYSSRLRLNEFEMTDADEVFHCITHEITRFLFWEPPQSLAKYRARREETLRSPNNDGYSFVIRRRDSLECLGIASIDNVAATAPELGIWLKQTAHGRGYGSEAVRAVVQWASSALNKQRFLYAVAIENVPSRRVAESLHGEIVGTRTSPRNDSLVYQIRW